MQLTDMLWRAFIVATLYLNTLWWVLLTVGVTKQVKRGADGSGAIGSTSVTAVLSATAGISAHYIWF